MPDLACNNVLSHVMWVGKLNRNATYTYCTDRLRCSFSLLTKQKDVRRVTKNQNLHCFDFLFLKRGSARPNTAGRVDRTSACMRPSASCLLLPRWPVGGTGRHHQPWSSCTRAT